MPEPNTQMVMLESEAASLSQENARLRQRIRELETKTYCAYCGESYELDTGAGDQIREHVATCEKHPMAALELERDQAATDARWLLRHLRINVMARRNSPGGCCDWTCDLCRPLMKAIGDKAWPTEP